MHESCLWVSLLFLAKDGKPVNIFMSNLAWSMKYQSETIPRSKCRYVLTTSNVFSYEANCAAWKLQRVSMSRVVALPRRPCTYAWIWQKYSNISFQNILMHILQKCKQHYQKYCKQNLGNEQTLKYILNYWWTNLKNDNTKKLL